MAQTRFSGPVKSDNGFINASDNGNGVTMTAPAALAASYTLVLPPNDGTNGQQLTTDGNGVLSWASAGGTGTVTSVSGAGTVNGLTLTGTVTSSGSLTLGGTLDLSAPPAIGGGTAAAGTFTALTVNSSVTLADAVNIAINATTGTKIGTATSQKIGFFNATPVIQQTTAVSAAAFVANTSGIADDTATFGGYTMGQVVAALKNLGLLA
jgi:hypothetical protein